MQFASDKMLQNVESASNQLFWEPTTLLRYLFAHAFSEKNQVFRSLQGSFGVSNTFASRDGRGEIDSRCLTDYIQVRIQFMYALAFPDLSYIGSRGVWCGNRRSCLYYWPTAGWYQCHQSHLWEVLQCCHCHCQQGRQHEIRLQWVIFLWGK